MNTNQFSAPSAININKYDSLNDKSTSLPSASSNPLNQEDKKYQIFTTNKAPTTEIDYGSMFPKIAMYTILSLPVLIILISIGVFLQQNNFNITLIGDYPTWVSNLIEEFVKTTIVPITTKQY